MARNKSGEETKTKIFAIALQPSVKEDLQYLCRIKNTSVNSFIETLVKDQIAANKDQIQKLKELEKSLS